MPVKARRRLWPEKAQGAVSLSYDGGDVSHLETAAPCLEALCLRATFYVPPTRVLDAPKRWIQLASAGNEIGNASLFDAAGPDGFLHDWTSEMVERDLEMTCAFHAELFGAAHGHSLAYPVQRHSSAESNDVLSIRELQQAAMVRPVVRRFFSVARGSTDGYNDPRCCEMLALRSIRAMDYSADELILLAQRALDTKAWAIFAFDGIGVGEPAIDAVEHAKFCLWLAERRSRAWVGTVHEIGLHLVRNSTAVVGSCAEQSVPAEARPTA